MQKISWIAVGLTYLFMVLKNGLNSIGSSSTTFSDSLLNLVEWSSYGVLILMDLAITGVLYHIFTSPNRSSSLSRKAGRNLILTLVLLHGVGLISYLGVRGLALSALELLLETCALGGLIAIACTLTWKDPVASDATPKLQRLARAGVVALLLQFLIGSVVRTTTSGLACPNFPNCLESFLPLPFTFETAIAFFHRWWGILLIGLFVHLATVAATKSPTLARPTRRAMGLSIAQIILGIGVVMSRLEAGSRTFHAAVGYGLWSILFYVWVRSGGFQWYWSEKSRLQ